MTGPLQVLLMAGPLAFYLYVLAIWQGGARPRVVSGAVDAALLSVGIGGLLTYGPFGQLVVAMIFGAPTAIHWVAMTSAMVLAGLGMVRAATRRVVVYHVGPEVLDQVMEDVLDLRTDRYVRTFGGFEHRSRTHGLRVHVSPLFGAAVIEAIGQEPERTIQELGGKLKARLDRAPVPPATTATILYGLSALTMLVALTGLLMTQPRTREALRVLLQKLQGG